MSIDLYTRFVLALVAVAFAVGCARAPGVPSPEGNVRSPILPEAYDLDDMADYDPWQPFNEVMFSFNHDVLDRFLVKPVATAWDTVIPRPARRAFARAIDNLDMPRRLVNNVLQFRPLGAGREVGRFLVNSTVGVAGLFDVASSIDLEKSDVKLLDLVVTGDKPAHVISGKGRLALFYDGHRPWERKSEPKAVLIPLDSLGAPSPTLSTVTSPAPAASLCLSAASTANSS
jgi:hypothetical protein